MLADLESLVIKPIARGTGPTSVFPWELSAGGADDLRRRIEAEPESWVGQEPLPLASVPDAYPDGPGGQAERVLRTFAVARQDSYVAMPGGLTRVAGPGTGAAPRPPPYFQPGRRHQQGHLGAGVRAGEAVGVLAGARASRGRHRPGGLDVVPGGREPVLDGPLRRTGRGHGPPGAGRARPAQRFPARRQPGRHRMPAGAADRPHPGQRHLPGLRRRGAAARLAAPGAELFALVVDDKRPGTLAHAVRHLVGAAQAVRDQLGSDTWMAVGTLEREIEELRSSDPDHLMVVQHTLGRIMQGLLALSGLFGEGMERDPGWRFMDAGRRLERGQQLVALLLATVTVERSTATDSLLLESVLIAAESIITYRRRYRSQAQLETLLDLLLVDPDNPRSLACQLDQLAVDVRLLPKLDNGPRLSEPERLVLEASTALRLADTAVLARLGSRRRPPRAGRSPAPHPGAALPHRRRHRQRPLRAAPAPALAADLPTVTYRL